MNIPSGYTDFIVTVKNRIRSAQYEALKAVNKELVGLYWDIGKMISEKQKELGWGKSVVEKLSVDLQKEFPEGRGYSASNLWFMVRLYRDYQCDKKLEPLVQEIGWSHNVLILKKCKTREERVFYLEFTRKFGWSKRVLDHQIDNKICKDVYKRLYSTRPTTISFLRRVFRIKRLCRLRTITLSTSLNYQINTRRGNLKYPLSVTLSGSY